MTVVKSRVKKGKLTLTPAAGPAVDFSCQPTSVKIGTEYNEEGDMLEVLCGDVDPPEQTTTRSLQLTAVQDFDNPDGLQNFLWDHEGKQVAFEWVPNSDGGPTYAGSVLCRVGDIGGDVGAQLTSDLELPCVGEVSRTYPDGPDNGDGNGGE